MSTLEFVSTSADGIAESSAPLVTAPALVAALGTHPALTLPLVCGRETDIEFVWRRLDETGRFYGTTIPPITALRDTLGAFLDEAAARHGRVALAGRVLVVEAGGQTQFVVSASVIDPVRTEPVMLAATPGPETGPAPHWRQMAARTTSQADTDLAERELNAGGYADEVTVVADLVGCPRLGALIFDTADGVIGSGGDGATRLALLRAVGLLDAVTCSEQPVAISSVTRLRWVSPRFETHPVSAIGAHRFELGECPS
jgi:hypothetical protein